MNEQAHAAGERVSTGTLLKRGAIGTLGAAVANVFVAGLADAALGIPDAFEPFALPRVAFLTVVGGVLAIVAYWIVQRVAEAPERAFVRVSAVALVVSFVPDVLLLVNPSAFPGTTTRGVLALMLMHVVAAVVIVPSLVGGWPPEDG